jgi:hypothetical protein
VNLPLHKSQKEGADDGFVEHSCKISSKIVVCLGYATVLVHNRRVNWRENME